MAEYKQGEMDITAQTAAYDGFVRFTKRTVVALIVLAVFLAIYRT